MVNSVREHLEFYIQRGFKMRQMKITEEEKLEQQREFDVPPELLHLIPGFLDRRMNEIIQMRNMLDDKDFNGIRSIGHKLKGHGASYGFPKISEIGSELQDAAIHHERKAINELIDRLEEEVGYLISKF